MDWEYLVILKPGLGLHTFTIRMSNVLEGFNKPGAVYFIGEYVAFYKLLFAVFYSFV